MTGEPEIEAVVRGLTKAQERAVRTLTVPDGGGKWPARHALVDKGLLHPFPRHAFTDLAHAVRQHLLRHPQGKE